MNEEKILNETRIEIKSDIDGIVSCKTCTKKFETSLKGLTFDASYRQPLIPVELKYCPQCREKQLKREAELRERVEKKLQLLKQKEQLEAEIASIKEVDQRWGSIKI